MLIYTIAHQSNKTLQVEFHPRLCQTELRRVCEEYGVCFQAYSSLGQAELVSDPVVMEVAKTCERTPAQVNCLTKHVMLMFFRSFLQTLFCVPAGVAALGCAAGRPGAPQVLKSRQNKGQLQDF